MASYISRRGTSCKHIEDSHLQIEPRRRFRGAREGLNVLAHQSKPSENDATFPEALSTKLLDDLRQDWYNLVALYSTCSLTESKDKLVAISAIARKLQQLMNDKYICGIWESHFHTNFLWPRQEGRLKVKSTSHNASTWSWAAYDGHIQYPNWNSPGSEHAVKPEVRVRAVVNPFSASQEREGEYSKASGYLNFMTPWPSVLDCAFQTPNSASRSGSML
jgi:hypothetical protein